MYAMSLYFHSIFSQASLFGAHRHIAAPTGFATFHASTCEVKSPNIRPSHDITAIIVYNKEYKPLTQAEEQRLRTEYYTNNNRVGYEKLYYAVRQPNGQTATGKQQYSPTIRQVQAWPTQQTVAQDYKPT